MVGLGNNYEIKEKPLEPTQNMKDIFFIDELGPKTQLPQDVKIQPLGESNLESALLLFNDEITLSNTYTPGEAVIEARRLNFNRLASWLYGSDKFGFVATSGDQTIGFLMGFEKNNAAYIRSIVTNKNSKRKEIAARLLSIVECLAKQKKLSSVYLRLGPENRTPQALYKNLGYKIEKIGSDYVRMHKNLEQNPSGYIV